MKVFFIFVGSIVFGTMAVTGSCWGAASRPLSRASTLKKQKVRIPPLKRSAPEPEQPWTLQTSIPLYIVGGGGLIVTSIGVIGSLSQPDIPTTGNNSQVPAIAPTPWGILFFGGLSMMASSVSASLWQAYPKQWKAILGTVITGGIALTGSLLAGLGQDTLTLSMGWGFLASLPIHIILNVVGWFNVRHHQIIRKQKDKANDTTANLTPPRHFRVQLSPSLIPNGAGIQLVGQF